MDVLDVNWRAACSSPEANLISQLLSCQNCIYIHTHLQAFI